MKYAMGFLMLCLIVVSASAAFAKPSEHLNWGSQINQGECPNGTLVINVTQKVANDVDSGVAGNYWASDNAIRHIQVVQTGSDTFCATVSYQGDFTTFSGPSPQNTGDVGTGVVGTFQGGYIMSSFTGTLNPTPNYRTKGNIGTFNYNCDVNGNCSAYVDWTTLYFSNTSGASLDWWGWTYHAGNNGSWVNSSGGNSGDITGN